jgi:hypothetical protein
MYGGIEIVDICSVLFMVVSYLSILPFLILSITFFELIWSFQWLEFCLFQSVVLFFMRPPSSFKFILQLCKYPVQSTI